LEDRDQVVTHWLENTLKRCIRDSVLQWYIHGVSFALPFAFIILAARPRKIFAKFMETTGHNSVRRVECLFDTITMMTVDVDVQNTRISAQEFDNAEDDIVDVAEPGGFPLFGMMQSSCPVDGDVGCSRCNSLSST
jgi:hypothetical protein